MVAQTDGCIPFPHVDGESFDELIRELSDVRNTMLAAPAHGQKYLDAVHPSFYASAVNLLHYLAFRRHDLRRLQSKLAMRGLSSLGRAEAHVLGTVTQVLHLLEQASTKPWPVSEEDEPALSFTDSQILLKTHTEMLFGPAISEREVRIMVTMPGEAADDHTLIHNLLKQGMNCMRINCAHDDKAVWLRMINHLKRAVKSVKTPCQIVMDLPGPKLRTGPMAAGAAVVHPRPKRDVYGTVVSPARIWLTSSPESFPPPSPADAALPVEKAWLEQLCVGEEIRFADVRESKRSMTVVDITPQGCWAELRKSAYIVPGTELCCPANKKSKKRKTQVGALPCLENVIFLRRGDALVLTRDLTPGRSATFDSAGELLTPASIGCTLPEIFNDVRAGEAIYLDDGKIGGIIEKVEPSQLLVRITHAHVMGAKLRADKGINLPDSHLNLSALTPQDLAVLPFVVKYADVVEFSFANCAEDVALLQKSMRAISRKPPAIVLKIETKRAFKNLPAMLLTAMRSPCCGVMIARGDLAVECGFERLAEVQEEILWICEAAHIPVIWATQVLETLAKSGMPSRAEITDAAMGHRAECVMLNKGPYVIEAIQVLDNILRRMQPHQSKKQSMLRELRIAHIIEANDPG